MKKRKTKLSRAGADRRLRKLALKLRLRVRDLEAELRHQRDRRRKRRRVYKLILQLPPLKIKMDGTKNHGRPHIHLDIGRERHTASVAIDSGEILAGRLKSAYKKVVRDWIEGNRTALMELWDQMQAGEPVDAMICEIRARSF